MDLLSPGAILKQLSLGVSFGPDALHLSLLSSHWERVRRVDAETIEGFQAMPPDRRRRRVQAFLERNRAAHCSVVVSLPRREVLLRQLELPLEARENLAKVVEYQRVHLLPSEEQAVATDTLAVREDSDPPGCGSPSSWCCSPPWTAPWTPAGNWAFPPTASCRGRWPWPTT